MLDELVSLIASATRRPVLVGLTGPVAVGKTTFANQLADALGLRVAIVSTDGFLFPNAELDRRGISMRKGFPESFDVAKLRSFLDAARRGEPTLRVPVYDHLTYDVVPDATVVVEGDVIIVEGVNALGPEYADAYDVTVYLDADEAAIVEWFCARLTEVIRGAKDLPGSFYAPFADWADDQIRQFAEGAWHGINAVNLEQHIRPARDRAQVVVEKGADHAVRSVRVGRP